MSSLPRHNPGLRFCVIEKVFLAKREQLPTYGQRFEVASVPAPEVVLPRRAEASSVRRLEALHVLEHLSES